MPNGLPPMDSIPPNFGNLPTILYVADSVMFGPTSFPWCASSMCHATHQCPVSWLATIGLTLATPNPLYVKGNYNLTIDGTHFAYTLGSTTNSPRCTVPAALLCDAITILTTNFNDSGSRTNIGAAGMANNTNTVNAAIITGNVPSTGISAMTFSGGVS